MAKNKVIPADIQADADKKHPNTGYKDEIYCDIGHRDRGIYIEGRLDERNKSANNAIEFATWVIQNFWSFSEKDKSWYNRTEVAPGKEYKNKTSQQLYELWEKSKSNADN